MGDDCQLPPLVVSEEAVEWGMDVSLLKRLIEAHPEVLLFIEYTLDTYFFNSKSHLSNEQLTNHMYVHFIIY